MAFDLERFTDTSEPLQWDDLDLTVFREQPLDPETLRTVRYMCDVEYHTTCFLRDLLVTPSHREEESAGFMTTWNREEFWHGEALAAVLAEHGIVVDYDEVKAKRLGLGWQLALSSVKQSGLANLVGQDFVAVHMTWGVANELSATAGYRRLAEMTDSPTLAALVKRIAQQETRHVAFYTTQARARLETSEKARKLVRLLLSKAWRPVGSGIMEEDEVRHVFGHLFGGKQHDVDKLDQRMQRIPGLEGLTIFDQAFRRLAIA
ncbi:MAG: ferritin-like domain-containing protein [Brachybacterium sp.]|nr:ferritin-like domain-containing protein [Brachybacterium sp.]MDN5894753.1 ferritin-like domain-containing protein [Nocardioides sp.]